MRFLFSLVTISFASLAFAAGCESSSSGGAGPTADGGGDNDGGSEPVVPSTCTAPTGPGTTHASVTASETWTAATSPHVISTSIDIPAGVTLTLEPCAVVQVAAGARVLVEGTLSARGAADKTILIERADAASAWGSMETRAGASVDLAYVTVDGGGATNGSAPTSVGMLDIRGVQEDAPQGILAVDHVTLKNSSSLGVLLREGGAFAAGSTSLTVTGGQGFPALVGGRAAGTLPTGKYSGNATDEIILPGNGGLDDIQEDTTLANLGVPYRVGGPTGGGQLTVDGKIGPAPLLTIAAGVTLRFEKTGRLTTESTTTGASTGALLAVGTTASPITFTSASATPAAGDWVGIVIEAAPDPRTKISFATIAYAGGASQISSFGCASPGAPGFSNDAAIIFQGGMPADGVVTNTTITDSAGEGIVRGWNGSEVDLLSTNTFSNIARCNETLPKATDGSCPATPPCPR